MKFYWILIRKMKYLTDQFQLCFCFLRQVSMLCNFCLFFKLCTWRFQQPSGDSGTRGLLGFHPSLRLRFVSENASMLAFCVLCHHPRCHFTKLSTRALLFGPCYCSYIFVPCLAFRVHVAGDLNKTISFVVAVLSTSFARALLCLIH